MSFPKLNVKLLNNDAKLPTYGSDFSAGLDLYCSENTIIPANSSKLISTGIAVSLSNVDLNEYYLRVAPRSGISSKFSLDVGAGVVDVDYRGEIKVLLFNHKNENYNCVIGDRIAQLIPERRNKVFVQQVYELDDTNRGSNGFGSSGI